MGCFLGMSASFHQKESGTKPGTVHADVLAMHVEIADGLREREESEETVH